VEHEYTLTYVMDISGQQVESNPAQQLATITLNYPVLSSVETPSMYAVVLELLQEAAFTDTPVERVYLPPGGANPVTITRPGRSRTFPIKFIFAPTSTASGKEKKEAFEQLITNGGPLFCYRDELQEKEFIAISSSVITPKGMDVYEVTAQCRRERYTEGVPL
jgi:hypothetical protein